MLDLREIRRHPEETEKKLRTKDDAVRLEGILTLDQKTRDLKTEVERLKSERNEFSKQIGMLIKAGKSAEADAIKETASKMADRIQELDHLLTSVEVDLEDKLARLPNLPDDDIPVSPLPADNVTIRQWKEKPSFAFEPKHHLELNEKLKLFDFERATKVAGSGWPAYRDLGARLEWALLNYMISMHVKNGFMQWMPPLLCRPEILRGSGQLPKFGDQVFRVKDDDYDLYLIPTAEVSLNGLHYDEIMEAHQLPLKYAAYTPCFRREAGAAGRNERGLIRTHQFNKVEMFAFCKPDESEAVFEQMLKSAGEILEGLGIHYRNQLLVTGDMSFGAARTVDVEVWLPGQNRYYEVSSVSNCTDFQARRSKIRFRKEAQDKPEFVHTLNGSGLATSRLMVALLENNQQPDGSVLLPEVLQRALGVERLIPQGH